jgi:uncharacterized protein YecE (DUF72 family)
VKLFIGTSGFHDRHWQKIFYPEHLLPNKWLEFYSKHFNSVELNVTFYRTPSLSTFLSWQKSTPKHFAFALKGSRFITHLARLKNCQHSLETFFENLQPILPKTKVILWQLPASLFFDFSVLEDFCVLLKKTSPARLKHAFEFRHPSFFCEKVYKLLNDYNYALCFADSKIWPAKEIITADFVYLRFHGQGALYASSYSEERLKETAEKIQNWQKETYVYFNNDAYGYAVANARLLKKFLGV